jgi:outer membrane protein OmpA-like peptidoglycan-associated protein
MESRFGRDFSQVQVHADTRAAESAEAVNALAYTIGNTVVFGSGKYVPSSSKGLHLLAHELARVVQQQQAGTGVQAEQRAGAAAEQVTRGQSVASSALGRAPVGLYTAPDDDKLSETSQKGMLDLKFKPLDPSLLTPNLNLAIFDKFALNSAKLRDEFKATVIKELADKILYLLQKTHEAKVVLTGHTDSDNNPIFA